MVQWNKGSATGTAVGTPGKPSNVTATTGDQADGQGRSTVSIQWGAADPAGAASVTYDVYRGDVSNCASPGGPSLGSSSPTSVSGVSAGNTSFSVVVSNGLFCNVATASTTAYQVPADTRQPAVGNYQIDGTTFGAEVDEPGGAPNVDHYEIKIGDDFQLLDGEWRGVPGGSFGIPATYPVRACGGPKLHSFCTAATKDATVAAFRTNATVTSAQQTKQLVVGAPQNDGPVTVSYTATWYRTALLGDVVAFDKSSPWTDPKDAPVPPATAEFVSVSANVSVPNSTATGSGEESPRVAVSPAPADSTPPPGN